MEKAGQLAVAIPDEEVQARQEVMHDEQQLRPYQGLQFAVLQKYHKMQLQERSEWLAMGASFGEVAFAIDLR